MRTTLRRPAASIARQRARSLTEPLERRVLLSAIYVDDTASGPGRDGTSWSTAYTSLQAALDAAAAAGGPDEIHIAAGTYRTFTRADPADHRSATFRLASGLTLLGGYPDGGGTPAQRDPSACVTTLTGDVGVRGNPGDNAYHVLTASGVDNTTVLDGLTVTGGNASRAAGGDVDPRSQGGGMWNLNASPTLIDCTFTANSAMIQGGAIYNGPGSSPTLNGCTFRGNTVTNGSGGGIHNAAGTSPTLTDCTFADNVAELGGGVANFNAAPVLSGCAFSNNTATTRGGGGIFNGGNATATVDRCTFTGNSAFFGGAMSNERSAATVSRCTFSRNTANWGGAINTEFSPTTLTDCSFAGNASDSGGGGIYSHFSALAATRTTFAANTAGDRGGAIQVIGAGAALTNCAFAGNTAGDGGAVFNQDASPTLLNSTFAGNVAGRGGALFNDAAFPNVVNSVLWGNRAAESGGGPQIFDAPRFGSRTSARHSVVQGGWAGQAILDADPLFVRNPSSGADGDWGTADDDFGDLRPRAGSPAVDAGDTAAVPASVTTDVAGQPRLVGPVDIGAYEFQPADTALYEAELADVGGAVVARNHSGFTGTGFVDFVHASGDSVAFAVDAPSAGTYELSFRYANGGMSARTTGLAVNGAQAPRAIEFARTGSWATWAVLPVTVSLSAGANQVRLVATGQSGPNVDSLSVRALQRPATYQAESATLAGPLALSNVPGFTGTGFADYQRSTFEYVEFQIAVPAEGRYDLDFRYANGSASDRPLELTVDGTVRDARLSFAPTGSWRTWKTTGSRVALAAGRHTVRLTSVGSGGPNLDALTVSPAAPPPAAVPVALQAEAATLSGAVVKAGNGGFTGGGYADYLAAADEYVEFSFDAPCAGDYALEFRYANGGPSDRPLRLNANDAVMGNLPFAPTGSWSTWGTASAAVTLAAGVNRIRLTSTSASGPNLDALTVTPPQEQPDVVYLSQSRTVGGYLSEHFWVYFPDEDTFDYVDVQGGDSKAAPDFGYWDASLTVDVTPPPNTRESSGRTTSTQISRLSDAGICAGGEIGGSTGTEFGAYGVSSDLDVTFRLTEPRDYVLRYEVRTDYIANRRTTISLARAGGGAVFEEVVPQTTPDDTATGTRSGTLGPGTYTYRFHVEACGDVSTSGPYDIELELSE